MQLTLTGPVVLSPRLLMVLHMPGPLPGLNEIIEAKGNAARVHDTRGRLPNGYTNLKRAWAKTITTIAQAEQIRPIKEACALTWVWCEKDQRRDPSNFTSGGRKLIEDALQDASILAGDGWRHITDHRDHWMVAPERVGVCVIASTRVLEREEAIATMLSSPPRYQRMVLPPAPRGISRAAKPRYTRR